MDEIPLILFVLLSVIVLVLAIGLVILAILIGKIKGESTKQTKIQKAEIEEAQYQTKQLQSISKNQAIQVKNLNEILGLLNAFADQEVEETPDPPAAVPEIERTTTIEEVAEAIEEAMERLEEEA